MGKTEVKKISLIITLMLIVILAAFIFIFCDDPSKAKAAGESGTQSDPYIITTAEQLKQLAVDVEDGNVDGYKGKYFVLESDLDLSTVCAEQTEGWNPIGDYLCRFNGVFDGNGHIITNLYISRPNENYIGLFSILDEGATVKNLTVYGTVIGKNNSGCISGQNYGRIENCFSYGTVVNNDAEMAMNVGGISGYNDGTVYGCGNSGEVKGNLYFAGGVVGINNGVIKRCFNMGRVNTSVRYGGGVVGMNSAGATVSEAFNGGSVYVNGNYSGGVAGANDGTVTAAYNTGNVSATDYVGGVCGNNSGSIVKTYNRSGVINGRVHRGAICGSNSGTLTDNFNSVTAYSECVDCEGVEDFYLSLPNVISLDGKMKNLIDESAADIWMKRDFDTDNWYLPELKFFANHENPAIIELSQNSAAVARTDVAAEAVVLSETEFIYNGTEHKPDVLLNGEVAEENVTYIRETTNGINAGEANVAINFINFYKGCFTLDFTIAKKGIEIIWEKTEFVYNGELQTPTVAQATGIVNDEVLTFEYETSDGITAKKHSVKAILPNSGINNNYFILNDETEYEIQKSMLSVKTVPTEYSGQAQKPALEILSGRVGEENIVFRVEDWERNITAGDYTINVYLVDNEINSNYLLTNSGVDHTITKKSAVITWGDKTLVYNGKPQHPSADIEGLIDGEDVKLLFYGYESNIAVGSGYTVYAEPQADEISENYEIARSECVYDIDPSTLTVEFSDEPLVYNGLCQYPSFTVRGLSDGDSVDFEISDYGNNINATSGADYSVTIELKPSGNYVLSPVTKSYGIAPKPVTVKWDSDKLVYNGEVQRPDAVVITETPTTVSLLYDNFSGKNAGANYSIDITSGDPNYTVINKLNYEILPFQLQAEWIDDTFTYNGNVQIPTAKLSKGIGDSDIPFEYDSVPSVRPSMYDIMVLVDDTNYIVNGATWQYEIIEKPIEIIDVSAENKTYDGTNVITLKNGRLIGLADGDEVGFVLGNGYSVSANAGVHNVQTEITLSGKDAECYTLSQPNVSVEITKALFDKNKIRFSSKTFAYDGEEKSIYIEGELPIGLNVEYVGNNRVDIGEYIVTAHFIDEHGNFENVSDISSTMFISKSEFSYTAYNIKLNILDGYAEYGSEFKVEEVPESIDKDTLGKNRQLVNAYSLSLFKDGDESQHGGRFKISVALDSEVAKAEDLTLLCKNGSNYVEVDYEIDGEYLVFYTDNLSVFVLTTEKNQTVFPIVISSIICLFVIADIIIVLLYKRRRK